jgi:hypothetical protein
MKPHLVAAAFSAFGLSVAASATELSLSPAMISSTSVARSADEPKAPGQIESVPARLEFAAEGSKWLIFTTGFGHSLSDSVEHAGDDFNLAAAYSYFIVKDVEVNAELGFWNHNQPGDNAQSGNASIVFRWHFIDTGDWTVYADIGIGALVATSSVPSTGTDFDFTPRAGFGFTRRLGDSDARLMVGLRWAHFSNARINGDDNNPARDDVMLYAGVILPF